MKERLKREFKSVLLFNKPVVLSVVCNTPSLPRDI